MKRVLVKHHGWTVTTKAGATLHPSRLSVIGRAFFKSRQQARQWKKDLQPHLVGTLHVQRVIVEMRTT